MIVWVTLQGSVDVATPILPQGRRSYSGAIARSAPTIKKRLFDSKRYVDDSAGHISRLPVGNLEFLLPYNQALKK